MEKPSEEKPEVDLVTDPENEDVEGLDFRDQYRNRGRSSLSPESIISFRQQEVDKRNARKKKRSLSELDGDPDNF